MVGSQPLDVAFLIAAAELGPSVLPGLVELGIGNDFHSTIFLGSFQVDVASGFVEASFPLMGSVLAGLQIFVQTGVFSFAAGDFPLIATNIESGTFF